MTLTLCTLKLLQQLIQMSRLVSFCLPLGSVNKVLVVRQIGQGSGVKASVEFEKEESVIKLAPSLPKYLVLRTTTLCGVWKYLPKKLMVLIQTHP